MDEEISSNGGRNFFKVKMNPSETKNIINHSLKQIHKAM